MNNKTRNYVFLAFYAALAVVLHYCTKFFPQMPNGGTLELEVIAIFIASFHLGWKYGMAAGLLAWVVGTLFGLSNYIVSPMQTMLDYIVPAMAPGIASIMPRIRLWRFKCSNVYPGIIVGVLIRYISYTLAGVYFWFPEGSASGSLAAWIYSGWTYNLAFNILTLVASIIIVPVLLIALRKARSESFLGIKEFED